MKRILCVIAILLASTAQAKILRAELFEVLKGVASKATSPIMREANEILEATREGLEHAVPGANGLKDQGFIILESNEKTGSAVVVKPIQKGSEVFGYKDIRSRDHIYSSDGDLEVGISSPVTVEQQRYISYYVGKEGDGILDLNRENPSFARIFSGFMNKDEELEIAAKELAIRYGKNPKTVVASYSRVVKAEDGNFVVVRSVRLNVDKIDAAEFDDVVNAAKELMLQR